MSDYPILQWIQVAYLLTFAANMALRHEWLDAFGLAFSAWVLGSLIMRAAALANRWRQLSQPRAFRPFRTAMTITTDPSPLKTVHSKWK